MHTTVKNIICLLSGLAAGGGLGVLCSKKYYQKKYSDFAEKQIREMEEVYGLSDPYARPYVGVLEEFGDGEVNPTEETNTGRENGVLSREKRAELRKSHSKEHVQTDYKSIYQGPSDPAEGEHPEDDEEEFEPLPNEATQNHLDNRDRPPRLISVDDAGELPNYIDHQALFYYTYDDTLADEDGNVEENIEELLGDCLYKYGFVDSEEERIFVMNYELDTCYEVQKLYASLGKENNEW